MLSQSMRRRFAQALPRRIVDRSELGVELGVELGAEPVHDGNDGERNAGYDKSEFNRRCAGLAGAVMARHRGRGRPGKQ